METVWLLLSIIGTFSNCWAIHSLNIQNRIFNRCTALNFCCRNLAIPTRSTIEPYGSRKHPQLFQHTNAARELQLIQIHNTITVQWVLIIGSKLRHEVVTKSSLHDIPTTHLYYGKIDINFPFRLISALLSVSTTLV